MKRAIVAVLVFVFVLALFGCGKNATESKPQETVIEDEEELVVDNRHTEPPMANFSDDDFESVGYLYNSPFNTSYYVLVTNNSAATVSVKGKASAKDENDNLMGIDEMEIDVLGPGETAIGNFYFGDVKNAAKVEYELSYSPETYFKPALEYLKVKKYLNEKNVTLVVTNEGEHKSDFVEAYVLFLDASGEVLQSDFAYFTNSDSSIYPGQTIAKQFDCSKPYDTIVVGMNGRWDGNSADISKKLDPEIVVSKEMQFETFGSTQFFIPVLNKSDQRVAINANATAKDSSGNIIGAANMGIDVLGPGETSLGSFYFSGVTNIDHIEYDLDVEKEDFYEAVVCQLEVEASLYNSNLMVNIKNHGSVAAEFVQCHAIALDKENNVVATDWTYVTDDNNEIAAGAAESKQLAMRKAFDHIDIYLTGRCADGGINKGDYSNAGITRITKNGVLKVQLDSEEFDQSSKMLATEQPTATKHNAPEPITAEPTEEVAPSKINETSATTDGLRSDFKAAMDAYEAFFDEYISFMEDYKENPTDISLLTKYVDMLTKMEEMEKKFDEWENEDLNSEEMKYYLEVTVRVEKKLIDII